MDGRVWGNRESVGYAVDHDTQCQRLPKTDINNVTSGRLVTSLRTAGRSLQSIMEASCQLC